MKTLTCDMRCQIRQIWLIIKWTLIELYDRCIFHCWLKPKHLIDRRYSGSDEFHKSLNFNADLFMHMQKSERDQYVQDLMKRRNVIHGKDLKNANK